MHYHVRAARNHMNTTFTFTLSVQEGEVLAARTAVEEAHALVERLEDLLSEFRPESPVSLLNRTPAFDPVAVPPEVVDLLERAEVLRVRTRGAFDYAFRGGRENGRALGWDIAAAVAWREHDRAHLGFGAIGKGYALDRVRGHLWQLGFQDFILSAGGSSIFLSGFSAPGKPWQWGWSWKKSEAAEDLGLVLSHRTGQPIAIGVSGTHEQGRHLVDPRTLQAAPEAVKSVLVATDSATEADALSTACFIQAPTTTFPEWADGTAVAAIDASETPKWNERFARWWGPLAVAFALSFSSGRAFADDVVDLEAMGVDTFNPYVFERHSIWVLLPAAALGLVLLHLVRKKRIKEGAPHEK